MSTTTDLTNLKINYLTQAQYDAALEDNEINEDEIYLTPPSRKMELIWSNPNGIANQTTTMGEEDVSVSSVSYDGFLVEFRAVYNDGARVYEFDMTGATGMYATAYSFKLAGNPLAIYRRSFYPVTGSKMHFSDCTRMTDSSAAVTGSDTGCLVPLRIWGIKIDA